MGAKGGDLVSIKTIREEKGFSQEDVARALNVSLLTYGRWERGNSLPRAEFILPLANLLGCKPDELLMSITKGVTT